MTDYALLIFTFSPIQSFIAEARRAEDMFNGSAILSSLTKAAAQALGVNHLVYPANLGAGDVSNVLTAKIPISEVESRAQSAQKAIQEEWQEIAERARSAANLGATDATWNSIWKRQIVDTPFWQIFWASAKIENGDYAQAYRQARELLGAVKHSRTFAPVNEPGVKDSLSGQREALHRDGEKAKDYWKYAAALPNMNSRLRPNGRERLDSIGLVKRFAELRQDNIPSVSTVAAWDFYQRAKNNASMELAAYRQTVDFFNQANNNLIYLARPQDNTFPFDGDLFFEETLAPGRMEENYGAVRDSDLGAMHKSLQNLYKKLKEHPSPYYAIIVLDGDSMGRHLDELLKSPDPEQSHREFSQKLADFSDFAKREVTEANGGFMVYNGGDDVVCMASREQAIDLAKRLAEKFHELTSCTASAGIVIAHYLTPLSIVLEEARHAEKAAKTLTDKNAVCVTLLKRSGSPLVARSKWADLSVYNDVLQALKKDQISARLPYAVERDALTLAALDQSAQIAGLKYLLGRHGQNAPASLPGDLQKWAANLDAALQSTQPNFTPGLPEVANWLVLARFMASDGGE